MEKGQEYAEYSEKVKQLRKKFLTLSQAVSTRFNTNDESLLQYYSEPVHRLIETKFEKAEFFDQVMIPLPYDQWPEEYQSMTEVDTQLTWPGFTNYRYTTDVLAGFGPKIEQLYFGYVVYEDRLQVCAFYVGVIALEEKLGEDLFIPAPAIYVIDPMAVRDGKTPDCYVGISVAREFLEGWIYNAATRRRRESLPLEAYVRKIAADKKAAEEKAERLKVERQNQIQKEKEERIARERELENKKKKVFIIRHASYIDNNNLSDPGLSDGGRRDAERLGERIKEEVGDREVVIWTSLAARASETADIVRNKLNTKEFVVEAKLWSDNKHREDFYWLDRKLLSFTEGVLIIITHKEYVEDFPELLGFDTNNSNYAQGVLIKDDKECKRFY